MTFRPNPWYTDNNWLTICSIWLNLTGCSCTLKSRIYSANVTSSESVRFWLFCWKICWVLLLRNWRNKVNWLITYTCIAADLFLNWPFLYAAMANSSLPSFWTWFEGVLVDILVVVMWWMDLETCSRKIWALGGVEH